ncbi:MAG: tlde1 domain-containing protein [Burkholderia ambifaria]
MENRYAAKRGTPALPACACAPISLRFDGRFLVMTGNASGVYPAVSGRHDNRGSFDYPSARHQMENVGPIPSGRYWIQPFEMWTNRSYNLASRAACGNYRLTIHVVPGTRTFGRGGFFIHGGTQAGSAGCINLHSGMENFVREIEAGTKGMPGCYVPLRVQY